MVFHGPGFRWLWLACLAPALVASLASRAALAAPPVRPNIVFILTDDQRFDSMWAMPLTLDRLADGGVEFTQAMITSPTCGPSRASMHSGGFLAQNTGMLSNAAGYRMVDQDTLALQLQRARSRRAAGCWASRSCSPSRRWAARDVAGCASGPRPPRIRSRPRLIPGYDPSSCP